jgi:hypothetical protein
MSNKIEDDFFELFDSRPDRDRIRGTREPTSSPVDWPIAPQGSLVEEAGDHFYRDGDGLVTTALSVPSAPGYGIANMRFNGGNPPETQLPPPSTGTWVLEDCKVTGVLSNGLGTNGAGFWIGEYTQAARLESFNNGWMNMVTIANCNGSTFTDLNLHNPKLVGLYLEHGSENMVFRRSRFGGGILPGSAPTVTPVLTPGVVPNSINAEWWYMNPVYAARFPGFGGRGGSRNNSFIDCEIYCPLPPPGTESWRFYQHAGAYLDAGTYGYRFERCRFYGPGKSLGYPTTALGPQTVWIDCTFDNAGGLPYTHSDPIGN